VTGAVATVCGSCPAGQAGLRATLAAEFSARALMIEVRQTDCMSGCARPSALAFRAPGKVAYLFGDITLADLPDLVRFAELYLSSADGVFADARPLGGLRTKAKARIPG